MYLQKRGHVFIMAGLSIVVSAKKHLPLLDMLIPLHRSLVIHSPMTEDNNYVSIYVHTYRYTFGERVDGMVRVNATLTASGRRESLPFFDTTVPLVSLPGL